MAYNKQVYEYLTKQGVSPSVAKGVTTMTKAREFIDYKEIYKSEKIANALIKEGKRLENSISSLSKREKQKLVATDLGQKTEDFGMLTKLSNKEQKPFRELLNEGKVKEYQEALKDREQIKDAVDILKREKEFKNEYLSKRTARGSLKKLPKEYEKAMKKANRIAGLKDNDQYGFSVAYRMQTQGLTMEEAMDLYEDEMASGVGLAHYHRR